MATDDEVRRLILEVVGEEKVRQLREQIDQEKQSLLALTATLSNLTPVQISQDKSVQLATQHLAELNKELLKTEVSHRNVGRAVLELSRGIEDLQYGVGGVINNIPGIVMALGGGAGLTGVISLLAVGINQLVKHYLPEWEGGVKKVKEKHHHLTEEMQEQIKMIKLLQEAETEADQERRKSRGGAAGDAIAAHREEIRSALGGQMTSDIQADIERLTAREAAIGAGPVGLGTGEELWNVRRNLARAKRRLPGIQREADVMIGRAISGGVPELRRLQGLFGADTAIGADLAEASPERVEQRRDEEKDIERQRRMHRLDETIARQKEQAAQKSGQLMGQAFQEEEQDLQRQHQADQHASQEKRKAVQHEVQASNRAAAAKEREAARAEREGIENVRFQADMAIGQGAPAGMVAQQANVMLNKIAATSGRTTNLVQAQGRLMLHLQQVAERQERQLEAAERDLQRGWDNAFRRGK